LAAALEQGIDLAVGQHPFAGPEDPAQVQRCVFTRARAGRGPFRDRLDLDCPRALDQVRRLVIELDGEHPAPRRQRRLQEIRNLDERLQQIRAGLVLIVEVRLARIGREPDEFRTLADKTWPLPLAWASGPSAG